MNINTLSPLGHECRFLLLAIEALPASGQATMCSVMCSALLEKIAAIPDKPKVRLEEITEVVRESWATADINGHSDTERLIAKAVCAHLNIELEEPKPEWEKAWDKELSQAGFKDGAEMRKSQEDFRLGFNAGLQSKGVNEQ